MFSRHFLIVSVTLLVIGVGVFIFKVQRSEAPQESAHATSTGVGVFDTEGNPVRITPIPSATSTAPLPTPPDMGGIIEFPSFLTPEQRADLTQKIAIARAAVLKDPTDVASWISLGAYFKVLENYEKTIAAWVYATKVAPADPVAYGNLGFLYGYYLHNNLKAEEYYLKGLEVGPDQVYLFFQTAEFYRDVMKDKEKARNIIEQGIAANPQNAQLLEDFKKSL